MESKVFGLVGHPVGHSMSKVMHEASFAELGLGHGYELFDVLPERVGDFLSKDSKEKGIAGLNVTIPHKQAVMKHLDELSQEAELIVAVNTIKFEGGKKIGFNTDGVGFIKSLEAEGIKVNDATLLVVGAGGAGRAITFQATLAGGIVSIADARADAAKSLSDDLLEKLDAEVPTVECKQKSLAEALADIEVLVNATPLGMHPREGDSILAGELIPEDTVVVDIVYNPIETKLLRDAGARGLKTVSGAGMLAHQGAESERIWLDVEPPVEVMKKAVLKELTRK